MNRRHSIPIASLSAFMAGSLFLGGLPISSVFAEDRALRSIKQADDGSLKLDAAAARIQGRNAELKGEKTKDVIWWTSTDTSLQWTAMFRKPGRYRVEMNYAIIGSNNGSPLIISVGNQILKLVPKAGNGFDDYKTGKAGEIEITKPGELPIVLKPLEKGREYVINIRSISLLPAAAPSDAIDISGEAIKQSTEGDFVLSAGDAHINGMNAQLELNGEKNIGYWQDVGTSLLWSINVQKAGTYRVEMDYSLTDPHYGSKVAITVGDQTLFALPKSTGEWTKYQRGAVGEVVLKEPGELPVSIKPVSKPWGFVMNLRSLALIPVDTPSKAIDISDKPISQARDGSLHLGATDAEIDGQAIRIEGGEEKYLVWWNSPDRFIRWPISVDKPGAYKVEVVYSLASSTRSGQVQINSEGENIAVTLPPTVVQSSEISLTIDGHSISGTLKAGEGWDDFKTESLGQIDIEKAGPSEAVLKSTREMDGAVMHLRTIRLIPVGEK